MSEIAKYLELKLAHIDEVTPESEGDSSEKDKHFFKHCSR